MRIFKTKAFARFGKKARIDDAELCQAIRDAGQGLIAANLGGGVIKQRIAHLAQGKSGGFRALIVFRAGARAFFVHGFAEEGTGQHHKEEFVPVERAPHSELLSYDDITIARVVAAGTLVEVGCNEKTIP